jgi:hypothetical protein
MQATPIPDEAALPADLAERLRSLPPINIYRLLGNVPPAVIPWTDMTRAVYQCWIGITPRSQSWIRLGIRRGASRGQSSLSRPVPAELDATTAPAVNIAPLPRDWSR